MTLDWLNIEPILLFGLGNDGILFFSPSTQFMHTRKYFQANREKRTECTLQSQIAPLFVNLGEWQTIPSTGNTARNMRIPN